MMFCGVVAAISPPVAVDGTDGKLVQVAPPSVEYPDCDPFQFESPKTVPGLEDA